MEILLTINFKDTPPCRMKMDKNIKDNGRTTKNMGKESTNGQTVTNMKENTKMVKEKDLE